MLIIIVMLWLHLQGQTSPWQHQSGHNITLIKVLHWAHILQVDTCLLLKIFLYNSQSGKIYYYCIFYIILQSWWKNFSQPCTGTMRVGVNLYTDAMICRHFVRLVHHISLTSSSVQQWLQIDMPLVRGIQIYSCEEKLHFLTSCLTLGINFKLWCTCLKFCHYKNKKLLHFT